ncbi:MAG: RagB/SusD family nutrient uptake outer membrane protein [Breznakibacter sp.]
MKNKLLIWGLVLATTLPFTISCNDEDFLTEDPETFYTIENSFNTTSQVDASLTTVYRNVRELYQFNYYFLGAGTDCTDTPGWRGGAYSDYSTWSADRSGVYDVYKAYYQIIECANLTLAGANLSTLKWESETERQAIIAQANFFLGWAYLGLAELYGGVPLVDQLYTTPKYDFERSTREETYKFAIAKLESAVSVLPNYPAEAGRVAKGAAYHYLAEAYLALGTEEANNGISATASFQKSIDNATSAISLHALMTDRFGTRETEVGKDVFWDLFQKGNLDYAEGNTEALWTLQNDVNAVKNGYDTRAFLEYPRAAMPVLRNVMIRADLKARNNNVSTAWTSWTGSIEFAGRAVNFYRPTYYMINDIWSGSLGSDMRNSTNNIVRNFVCNVTDSEFYGQTITDDMLALSSSTDCYYPVWFKLTTDQFEEKSGVGWDGSYIFRDKYACRLAETYLIRAEAYFRNGNSGLAASDINVLRTRANCTYQASASDITLNFILDERARELYMEELRWHTLLRMGGTVAYDRINTYAYYLDTRNRANTATSFSGTAPTKVFNLWPIPRKVIDANSGAVLEQNPGWE